MSHRPRQITVGLLIQRPPQPLVEFLHILEATLRRLGGLAVFIHPIFISGFVQGTARGGQRVVGAGSGFGMARKPLAEIAQPLESAGTQAVLQPQFQAGPKQAGTALGGIVGEFFQGIRPDLAARGVDDAQEGAVVIGIDQQAQIRHHVLDLAAVEKALPAAEKIGDGLLAQGLLEGSGLVVAAIENGVITEFGLVDEAMVKDFRDYAARLVLLIAAGQHANRIARTQLAPEPFFVYMGVVGDQSVRRGQDPPHGPVVLLQLDHLQVGEIFRQPGQILRFRAAPGIDALVIVADHGQTIAFTDQQPDQQVLGLVGVLVFVHQQVSDLRTPTLQHIGVLAEQIHREQDKVVEVHRIAGAQTTLIGFVVSRVRGAEFVFGGGRRLHRRYQGILPGGDLPDHAIHVAVLQQFLASHQFSHNPLGITGIENGKTVAQADVLLLAAQQPQAEIVEGGHVQSPPFPRVQQRTYPGLHLSCRLVGEGHRRNRARRQGPFTNQIDDLLGNDTGLATARTGQDQ